MRALSSQVGSNVAVPELVYHWTKEENIQKIVENNLRPPGEANLDGSRVDVVNGTAFGRGIYAATNLTFGQQFGNGAPCAFLCLALPGHTIKGGRQLGRHADSVAHHVVRVYRASDQLLPLFVTDSAHEHKLRKVAQDIADFLQARMGVQPTISGVGNSVLHAGEAIDVKDTGSGCWYPATVLRRDAQSGAVDVAWSPPFAAWPPERLVEPHRVRRRFLTGESVEVEDGGTWYAATVSRASNSWSGNCAVAWSAPYAGWPPDYAVVPERIRRAPETAVSQSWGRAPPRSAAPSTSR